MLAQLEEAGLGVWVGCAPERKEGSVLRTEREWQVVDEIELKSFTILDLQHFQRRQHLLLSPVPVRHL